MSWIETEVAAAEWYKLTTGEDCIPLGGSNSKRSDIFLPRLGQFIEVKDFSNDCRAGQFCPSTIKKNPFSAQILREKGQNLDTNRKWVYHHYKQKNVIGFITFIDNEFAYWSIEEFCANFNFLFSHPKSDRYNGSKQLTQEERKLAIENFSDYFKIENGKVVCKNENDWNKDFLLEQPELGLITRKGNKRPDLESFGDVHCYTGKQGQIRKLASGKTKTYEFLPRKREGVK